jgi:hypothetical protein
MGGGLRDAEVYVFFFFVLAICAQEMFCCVMTREL